MNETVYWSCGSCSEHGEAKERLDRCPECGATEPDLRQSDEPHGSGRDPFGRPDPAEHPEFWTE